MIPLTGHPFPTRKVKASNAARLRAKPYARYFDERMFLREEALPALDAPLRVEDALTTDPADLNRLLEPGYLPGETGYCSLPDGTAYTASLTRFPGCTAAMFRWWFWWHSFEAERYALWHPWCHVSVRRDDSWREHAPGLSDEERYIGSTHVITEYIGDTLGEIAITFVDPAAWGFRVDRFAEAGISGHACGVVRLQRPSLEVATMVHLIRDTEEGFELRSRYWLGNALRLGIGGARLNIDPLAAAIGLKRRRFGERMAYEQLLHDQAEFTHLAGFLAGIYGEFGPEGRIVSPIAEPA